MRSRYRNVNDMKKDMLRQWEEMLIGGANDWTVNWYFFENGPFFPTVILPWNKALIYLSLSSTAISTNTSIDTCKCKSQIYKEVISKKAERS